jgi:hypothetical protein
MLALRSSAGSAPREMGCRCPDGAGPGGRGPTLRPDTRVMIEPAPKMSAIARGNLAHAHPATETTCTAFTPPCGGAPALGSSARMRRERDRPSVASPHTRSPVINAETMGS